METPSIREYRIVIESALAYGSGTHTFDDIVELVESGRAQFWPGLNSAVVTQIDRQPRRNVLYFFLAGGNLAELEAMEPLILEWGREQGCTLAAMLGRPGWERTFMQRSGWKSSLKMFEKELT